ncbi:Tad domain-containing protein [Nocardioides ochotonae]|uniref:Tad domain-containing protein n=1 Tax=Nocardioides ochotonae TaxID=2685869 RepID=UPI00140BBA67|nr:Tad domain-containing protein [Nocardioides ochotonae]
MTRSDAPRPGPRLRAERGQVTPLIVGFALIIALTIAVVIDATAAYLQRSELSTLADGAALHGADLGATGVDVYTDGLPDERLRVTVATVRAAVADYLRQVGAHGRYPGLTFDVGVGSDQRVTVELSAPLDLPLTFPGSPSSPRVGATGSAVSSID